MSKFYPDPFQQRVQHALQGAVVLVDGGTISISASIETFPSQLAEINTTFLSAIPQLLDIGTSDEVQIISRDGTDEIILVLSQHYAEVLLESNISKSLVAVGDILEEGGSSADVQTVSRDGTEEAITFTHTIFTSVS